MTTYATLAQYARYRASKNLHGKPRQIREWARLGYFPLFEHPDVHAVVVDIDQADAAIEELTKQGKIRPDYRSFAGQTITPLTPEQVAASLPRLTDAQAEEVGELLGTGRSKP